MERPTYSPEDLIDDLMMLGQAKRFGQGWHILHPRLMALGLETILIGEFRLNRDNPIRWQLRHDPYGWHQYYHNRHYGQFDVMRQIIFDPDAGPVSWLDLRERTREGSPERRIFIEAEGFGLFDGLIVPAPMPRGNFGGFSVAGPLGCVRHLGTESITAIITLATQVMIKEARLWEDDEPEQPALSPG